MTMKITLPTYLIKIMKILENANEEVYLVGGFVRDMVMHKPCHDYDLTTSAHPDKMIQLFQSLGYSLILTGKQHGTIIIQINNKLIEITTYRIELNYKNYRSPDTIIFADNIYEDLKRRDFTINAMAYHPLHGIIDPFQGQTDIKHQIIKAVGDPFLRLQEDALRILRAIRFECCFSFRIEIQTTQAIIQYAHLLTHISKERIQQEFYKMLTSPQQDFIQLLNYYHVLPYIFTPFSNTLTHQVIQQIDHILNRSIHQSFLIRFTTILYGLLPYHSMDTMILYLQEMKYSKKSIQHIKTILTYHTYDIHSISALRKLLFMNLNEFSVVEDIIHFQYVIQTISLHKYQNSLSLFNTIKQNNDIFYKSDLAINGHDLLAFGYHGKQIHDVLQFLYELVIENPSLNTRQSLLSYISNHLN